MPKPPVPPGKAKNQEATTMAINEGLYCEVDPGNRTSVDAGPSRLQQNWTSPVTWTPPYNAKEYYNVNNTDNYDDNALLSIGLNPYVENDTPQPGPYYTRTLSDFTINATNVSRDVVWVQWDIEQVRNVKRNELDQHLRDYDTFETARQLAVDELLAEPMRDTTAWEAGRQVLLASLDVWDDVANFDTSKPDPLPLTNTYIGAKLGKQGVVLQQNNDAVIAAGGAPLYDVTELNAFISGNVSAGQDVTGGTQPVDATYTFRQNISAANENINTLVLTREYKGFPGAEWGWKATLKRNGDSKTLYIFSYLADGTYLNWRIFAEVSPGIWEAVSHSSEDRTDKVGYEYILSYGSNPAVEADYFTNKMPFPANSEEEVRRIRYDD